MNIPQIIKITGPQKKSKIIVIHYNDELIGAKLNKKFQFFRC